MRWTRTQREQHQISRRRRRERGRRTPSIRIRDRRDVAQVQLPHRCLTINHSQQRQRVMRRRVLRDTIKRFDPNLGFGIPSRRLSNLGTLQVQRLIHHPERRRRIQPNHLRRFHDHPQRRLRDWVHPIRHRPPQHHKIAGTSPQHPPISHVLEFAFLHEMQLITLGVAEHIRHRCQPPRHRQHHTRTTKRERCRQRSRIRRIRALNITQTHPRRSMGTINRTVLKNRMRPHRHRHRPRKPITRIQMRPRRRTMHLLTIRTTHNTSSS